MIRRPVRKGWLLDKQKKKIMMTILIIAFIQMPIFALQPGINRMRTTAFPEASLGMVQTALAFTSLMQPLVALGTAFLVNRRIVTKKIVIMVGLCLLAIDGLLALNFNSELWHLFMLSVVLGMSVGCIHPNMFGLIFDNFEPHERQMITGYQSSIINMGGIVLGLVGGVLATYVWYGGYLVLFVGIPAAMLVFFAVPNYWAPVADRSVKKTSSRIKPKVYYYCVIGFLYMMVYMVCGANLSTHIEHIGDSATAGIGIAFLMGGGVVSGLVFAKISKKLGDYAIALALGFVFTGYLMLNLFQDTLPLVFAAVFLVGLSLSIVMPRCIFMVSTLATDKSNSQTATALVTTVLPAMGSFLSPVIFTNVTTALYGESTAARYLFVGVVVFVFGTVVALVTFATGRKRGGQAPQAG